MSETRFRQVAESAGEWIWEVDADGLYTYSSPIVEKIMGYTPEDHGREKVFFRYMFAPEATRAIKSRLSRGLQEQGAPPENYQPQDPQERVTGHSGEQAVPRLSARPDNSSATVSTGLDITERRMAENALEQARKKLGLLNMVIFQDIQSTIFALSAYMQLAVSDHEGSKAKSYAEKEAFLVHKIINSLNFAKNYQELGVQPSRWQNVNQVFLYAISHLDSLKITRKIQMNGLEIYADPLLEKVFFNLIENIFLHGQTVTESRFTWREEEGDFSSCSRITAWGFPRTTRRRYLSGGTERIPGLACSLSGRFLSITGISIQELAP